MDNMINFGIDLGTTNSTITKFNKGEVIVFNNPIDYGRNTLPSVVGFRKDKIFVGSKAKELIEKDPKSVIGTFKRKMGTSESFKIKSINESKTPIELSSLILKELKTFLPPNENIDSVVITIPASFDMVQSNATKEAGFMAGFKQVLLLQEPIAASLAYANMKKEIDLKDGYWLVYDLGGGTFDAALVKISSDEMNVLDHEGDNFLGGSDFDSLIVEKILIPKIENEYSFDNIIDQLKSASGRLNSNYYSLIYSAEKAKIDLSARSSTEIEISGFEDDNGAEVDMEIIVTRSEFNELIKEYIDTTNDMVKKILTRNTLKSTDIQFTLMVGGSSYIPFVRQRVEDVLQIPINCEIDPTTAIAVGAAFYAATKPKQNFEINKESKQYKITVKSSYQKSSKEKEELFSAKILGNFDGLFYRIVREDGGFDTGIKKLMERISEDLPLVDNTFNFFKLTVYDIDNNVIDTDFEMIGINSGFGISGQPLPEDISVEIDDENNPEETKLFLIFSKNTILPTKKSITRVLNKSLIKGNEDENIRINVVEGSHLALPDANKSVGFIDINGKSLSRDITRGSDIELTFEITESRDLTVSAYLNMANQEFKQTFNPKERHTPINILKNDIKRLSKKLDFEIEEATNTENYEAAAELDKVKKEMNSLLNNSNDLVDDDVTDKRYQLEDKKRKIAQAIDNATKGKRILTAKALYFENKEKCERLLDESGNDIERKHFRDIISLEQAFLTSNSPLRISEKSDSLHTIIIGILWRTPDFLVTIFDNLENMSHKMNDQTEVKSLIEAGRFAVHSKNWDRLSEINSSLINRLPKSNQNDITKKIGF
jgi:molecular chaperone DnaK